MDIVKTGLGLTRTFKNVARAKEILTVFAKNGFDEFIIKTNLHLKVPGFVIPKSKLEQLNLEQTGDTWWESLGIRLRRCFEELGPSFIKLGQLLSTREDIFHQAFIEQMKLLQDQVKPIPFEVAKKVIEKNLPASFDTIFESIVEQPIGTASIGTVYLATLKTGEKVVIKVRRPHIKKSIETDFDILLFIVQQFEKVSGDFRSLRISKVVSDFNKALQMELNFFVEANNCKKLKKNLVKYDDQNILKLPHIYDELSSEEVLVMEYLEGKPFNKIGHVSNADPELEEKLIKSVFMFVHTLLGDGFFHADLHGGNFLWLNNKQIGIIDFGLMGSLSKKNRINLVAILHSLLNHNFDQLVSEFLEVAEYQVLPDQDDLVRDLRDALTPYLGLSVQQTDFNLMVKALVFTLNKHQVFLPREWFIIFRALITLDGVGKSLEIDLNIFDILENEIESIAKGMFGIEALTEEFFWLSRDVLSSLRSLPRHVRWFSKGAARRNYALQFELTGHEKQIMFLGRSLIFSGLCLLSTVFFAAGFYFARKIDLALYASIPAASWICWAIGAAIVFRGLVLIRER